MGQQHSAAPADGLLRRVECGESTRRTCSSMSHGQSAGALKSVRIGRLISWLSGSIASACGNRKAGADVAVAVAWNATARQAPVLHPGGSESR